MGDTKFRQTGRRTAVGPYRADEKARKRIEGEERNAAWAALSAREQFLQLTARRGQSRRQIAKLAPTFRGGAQQ